MIALANDLLALVCPSGESSSPDIVQDADQHRPDISQRQRTSYLINLHSIKMFVLKSAIQPRTTGIGGLTAEPLMLSRRKIELAQDFVNILESVPFLRLQVEGESCVSIVTEVYMKFLCRY